MLRRLNEVAAKYAHVLESLLTDSAVAFEDSSKLRHALNLYQPGKADFNDSLILATAQSQGARLETFDKKLRQSMSLDWGARSRRLPSQCYSLPASDNTAGWFAASI